MTVRPEHRLYSDYQIDNATVLIVDDNDPDVRTVMLDTETDQLILLVRESFPREDEILLWQHLEAMRYDWLGVLGYGDGEAGSGDVPDELYAFLRR